MCLRRCASYPSGALSDCLFISCFLLYVGSAFLSIPLSRLFIFRLPPEHAPTFTFVFVGMSRASSQVSPRVLLPLLVLSA